MSTASATTYSLELVNFPLCVKRPRIGGIVCDGFVSADVQLNKGTCFSPNSGMKADMPIGPRRANSRQGFIHFGFVKSFATSRACLMKSRATEPSVRSFRVTISLGTGPIGSWTGKALTSVRLVGNRNAEAENIVRKGPVAGRLNRACGDSVTTIVRG